MDLFQFFEINFLNAQTTFDLLQETTFDVSDPFTPTRNRVYIDSKTKKDTNN